MSVHSSSLRNGERDIKLSSPVEGKASSSALHLPFHQLQRSSVRSHTSDFTSRASSPPKYQRLHVSVEPANPLEPLAAAKASVPLSSERMKMINGRKDQFGTSKADRYNKNHNSLLKSPSKMSGFVSNAAAKAASRLSTSKSHSVPDSSIGMRRQGVSSSNSKRLHKEFLTSGSLFEIKDPSECFNVATEASASMSPASQKPVRIRNRQSIASPTSDSSQVRPSDSHYISASQNSISKYKDYIGKTKSPYLVYQSSDHPSRAKPAYKYPSPNFDRSSETSYDFCPLEVETAPQSKAVIKKRCDDSVSHSSIIKKAAESSFTSAYSEVDWKKRKDEQSFPNYTKPKPLPYTSLSEEPLPAVSFALKNEDSNDKLSDEIRNAAVVACNPFSNLEKNPGNTLERSTLPSEVAASGLYKTGVSHPVPYEASTKTHFSSLARKVQPQHNISIPNEIPLAAARSTALFSKHDSQSLKDSHSNGSKALLFAFNAANQVSDLKSQSPLDESLSYHHSPKLISSAHIAANHAANEKVNLSLRPDTLNEPLNTTSLVAQNKNSVAVARPSISYHPPYRQSGPLPNRKISASDDVFYDAVDDERALAPPSSLPGLMYDSSHNTEESFESPVSAEVDKLGSYSDTDSSGDELSLVEKGRPISSFKDSILNFSNDTAKALKWRLAGVLQPEKAVVPSLLYLHREALDSSSAVHAAAIADRSFPVVQEKPPPLKSKTLKKPSPRTLRGPTKKKNFFSKRSNGRYKNARVSQISKKVDIPRFVIDENRRKLYEGLWAANKGYLLRDTDVANPENYVCDIVVRELWSRCGAPTSVLANIYNLVDRNHSHMLNREEFIVGLFLIDQYLTGKKLPLKVPDSVWISSKRMGEMLWRLEKLQKKTRSKKKRFKRKVYEGLKWELGSDQEDKGEEDTATL
ncbi:ENTH/VHS domain-containing protein [Schizosaccharomyces cryophilus OY26]|uniref:ENTH/VHS domain-containing protein n=1 Tax=Schizosaccharomyces cryophilus (strain OY26 / ATCC MYA-4695 / CBS 11777 / NBRC 106824 / NRRL Y48691) TaxID=653667 RepID=S9XAE4_SCHCR|nr:ENTH/VHS domain-containing protein [Schizosaccharomyces cryophilus OY26]EPY50736.1 ENTH/VHS domain-containing protein [Schizosaccharomyces cryophilus OY26]